jgi:hypothetical protein
MEDFMKSYSKLIISITGLYVLLLFANPAHAYIDPGTGSMLVQAAIAVVAAASVSIGVFRHRLRSFLSRIFGRKKDE